MSNHRGGGKTRVATTDLREHLLLFVEPPHERVVLLLELRDAARGRLGRRRRRTRGRAAADAADLARERVADRLACVADAAARIHLDRHRDLFALVLGDVRREHGELAELNKPARDENNHSDQQRERGR